MKFIEENLKDGKLRVTGALQAFKKHLKSNEAHQLAVLITWSIYNFEFKLIN